MKLQILVPQYKETDDVVKPLLDSIALQQCIDFNEIGVIICNDGTDVHLSNTFLKSYPFDIQYYLEPHRGVSGTRNACLDYADADYVMFCDADDMFCNVCGLWVMFNEMDQGFDSMVSVFTEETRDPSTGKHVFINREMDSTFVHGKIHRRRYLTSKNLRFKEELTIHEDSYFNILAQNCSDNVKYCPVPFYLWKWRDESVCRHDPKYILKTFTNMIDSSNALIDELERRGMYDKIGFYAAHTIFTAYYMMCKPEWKDQENKEYRDNTERHFSKFFHKHKAKWEKLSDQEKMTVSNIIRNQQIMEGMQMETMTISEWLKQVESLYEE